MRYVKLAEADNLVVALDSLAAGDVVGGVVARARIPRGHKMAVAGIAEGAPVIKYGETIGFAASSVEPGDWVHDHNLRVGDFERLVAPAKASRSASGLEGSVGGARRFPPGSSRAFTGRMAASARATILPS